MNWTLFSSSVDVELSRLLDEGCSGIAAIFFYGTLYCSYTFLPVVITTGVAILLLSAEASFSDSTYGTLITSSQVLIFY